MSYICSFTILKCLFRGLVIGMGILFKVIWMGLLYSLKVTFIMSKSPRPYQSTRGQFLGPIYPHFENGHWDWCTVQGVWMGQLVPNDTLIDFTKLYQDQRAYVQQVIQYMLPIWPHFANGHWDRCTVQGVWIGQLVPNDSLNIWL